MTRKLSELKEEGNSFVRLAAAKEQSRDLDGWRKGLSDAMEKYQAYLAADELGGVVRAKVLSNCGVVAGKLGRPAEAIDQFSEALTIMQSFSSANVHSQYAAFFYKLHKRRADAYLAEGWHEDALSDYEEALSVNPSGPAYAVPEVHYRRGLCYVKLDLPASAYEEFHTANDLARGTNKAFLDALQSARRLMEDENGSQRRRWGGATKDEDPSKNYHAVLGVRKGASAEDIRKAYRRLVVRYHPDKHSNSAPTVREVAEQKVKEINEAFAVLSGKMEALGLQSPVRTPKGYRRR
ncbi:DnaJ sub C member 3 [Rhizophlyctis rosea]|nr:DnaJ sub C member 3 [Rhizophlyctis rosea]